MAEVDDRVIRAAGGVVWRGSADDPEIAIIHRPRYDDWSIPKGKLAPGETDIEGAIREVHEETGFRVEVGRPLGEVRYMKESGGITRPKVVRYWVMHADGGSFVPTREVDELKWLPIERAKEIVTQDHDRDVIDRFRKGPIIVATILLVRHASAGDREEWTRDDRLRPLDLRGWEQAEELARLLSRFEVERIVAADFRRCVQTVQPLSEAISVSIEQEWLFSEDGFPGSEERAVDAMRALAKPGSATVVCSQGGVVPDIVGRLAEGTTVELPDTLPQKKASVWMLTFDGFDLIDAEYLPPPQVEA